MLALGLRACDATASRSSDDLAASIVVTPNNNLILTSPSTGTVLVDTVDVVGQLANLDVQFRERKSLELHTEPEQRAPPLQATTTGERIGRSDPLEGLGAQIYVHGKDLVVESPKEGAVLINGVDVLKELERLKVEALALQAENVELKAQNAICLKSTVATHTHTAALTHTHTTVTTQTTTTVTATTITTTTTVTTTTATTATTSTVTTRADIAVSAAGGDSVIVDGDYKIHTFTSSGDFEVSYANAEVAYLVVGGGGGGGYAIGGGGGGGGFRTASDFAVSVKAYAITVGAGGKGGESGLNVVAEKGNDSTFGDIKSVGGGGGGHQNSAGGSGGSGGGAGALSSKGGAGTAGQGFKGGYGVAAPGDTYSGGGGGGAGEEGHPAIAGQKAGDGGDGLSSSITGSDVVYAGGGGGGAHSGGSGTAGKGGKGGGGDGEVNNVHDGGKGAANLGGGGGGGFVTNGKGGPGGAGVVIIRYKFQ
jgi:hypothetical protein